MKDIKTCEEYVLNELNKMEDLLDAVTEERDRLKEENEKLKNRMSVFGELMEELEKMLPKENGKILSDLRNLKVNLYDDPVKDPNSCTYVISFDGDKIER